MDHLAALGYKIAVCPIESLLVTAHAMQRLVETLKTTGRVDQTEGMVSFGEVKEILGVEEFLRLREAVDGG
jgi:2-methylisocitrate lyase-like PEP mutase family enzyme